MGRRILRLGFSYLFVLATALLINFAIPRVMPGSPFIHSGEGAGGAPLFMSSATLGSLEGYFGLGLPLSVQLQRYLTGLARLDLGVSITYRAPVSELLLDRAPWTLLLTVSALLLNLGTVLLFGTGARSGKDRIVLFAAIILESMPPFALAGLLLVLLGVKLPLFPVGGACSPLSDREGFRWAADVLHHAALPVLVLSTQGLFSGLMVVRNSLGMARGEPSVLMAELKGLSPRIIRYRYVLRLALPPVVSFYSLRIAFMASGAIFVEVVFAYPGLGRLMYEAVSSHDYPLAQGVFLAFTLWVLIVNFVTDCLYPKLDPRVEDT